MIKILATDDEKYVRDSIKDILKSEFKDEIDIMEATNGREAIEFSEEMRPDVIIMDIKMPGINGLKAIEEIKKFLPKSFYIIITAYDYFDFALEALERNVNAYILKPFSKQNLIEKIQDAFNKINSEKQKRKRDIENEEKIYNMIPIIENDFSFSIINNSLETLDYKIYMEYLGIQFENACAMVVQFKDKPNNEEILDGSKTDVKISIGEHIKSYIERTYKTIASYRFTKELVFFIEFKEYETEEVIRTNMVNIASRVRHDVKNMFNASIRIGIGKNYEDVLLLNKSYEEAKEALKYNTETLYVIHTLDIKNDAKNNYKGKIALFKSIQQYITNNIKENLDLENIAERFNISSYYFSRTFKKVVGYNFSDYINMERIKMAKELLCKENMSVKEVCYLVGYSEPNYFSKVFKKYEGVTPTEFKAR